MTTAARSWAVGVPNARRSSSTRRSRAPSVGRRDPRRMSFASARSSLISVMRRDSTEFGQVVQTRSLAARLDAASARCVPSAAEIRLAAYRSDRRASVTWRRTADHRCRTRRSHDGVSRHGRSRWTASASKAARCGGHRWTLPPARTRGPGARVRRFASTADEEWTFGCQDGLIARAALQAAISMRPRQPPVEGGVRRTLTKPLESLQWSPTSRSTCDGSVVGRFFRISRNGASFDVHLPPSGRLKPAPTALKQAG